MSEPCRNEWWDAREAMKRLYKARQQVREIELTIQATEKALRELQPPRLTPPVPSMPLPIPSGGPGTIRALMRIVNALQDHGHSAQAADFLAKIRGFGEKQRELQVHINMLNAQLQTVRTNASNAEDKSNELNHNLLRCQREHRQ